MATIFGRTRQRLGGSFASDSARMNFTAGGRSLGASGISLIVTGLGINFQQRISRAYDVLDNFVYMIQGRAEGNGNIDSLKGPKKLALSFIQAYGSVCNMEDNNLVFSSLVGCGTATGAVDTLTARNVVFTTYGEQVSGEEMMIRRGLGYTYVELEGE